MQIKREVFLSHLRFISTGYYLIVIRGLIGQSLVCQTF